MSDSEKQGVSPMTDRESSKPSQEELERAHACMSALRAGLQQARALSGERARMEVGNILDVIDAFEIGAASHDPSVVEGPFFPRGVQ